MNNLCIRTRRSMVAWSCSMIALITVALLLGWELVNYLDLIWSHGHLSAGLRFSLHAGLLVLFLVGVGGVMLSQRVHFRGEMGNRFRQSFQNSAAGYVMTDLNGKFLQVNQTWCDLLGYSELEMLRTNVATLVHPDDMLPGLQPVDRILSGEIAFVQLERRYLHRLGHIIWTHVTISLVDTTGMPPYLLAQVIDLTEQKRAQAAAREQEDRLHLVTEHASDLIGLHTFDGAYVYASPSCQTMLGYTPDEMGHFSPMSLCHRDDLPLLEPVMERLEQRISTRIRYRMRQKEGSYIWVETATRPIQDGQGKIIHFSTCTRDITAQKQVEDEVRESEDRYRALFENNMDAVILARPGGLVFAVNEAACRMFDRTADEFIHLSRSLFWDPRDPRMGALLDQRDRTGMAFGEMTGIRRDGSTFPMEVSTSFYRDRYGLVVSNIMRDLSERQQSQETLQHYAERLEQTNGELRSLIGHIAEGFIAIDEAQRIVVVNPAACRLLQVTAAAVEGELVHSVSPFPQALVAALQRVQAVGSEGEVVSFTTGNLEVQAHAVPLFWGETRAGGAVAVLQDVSAQVQLQHMRENFMADVSHELRGPLSALSGVLEALRDGLIAPNDQGRFVERSLGEIGRLHRVVDDLLMLTRLNNGVVPVLVDVFDIRPLLQGVTEVWGPQCQANQIELTMDATYLPVRADYDRVEQILANLISNAIRYTPKRGQIRLRAEPESTHVRVSVTDTGCGIKPTDLPFVWDRFYKVDLARTRSRETGTGLGLAIVKALAEQMGGQVHATSEVGEGSVFSFLLPRVDTTDEAVRMDATDQVETTA